MQQLNIKNEETYFLAQELSRLTGESLTVAVKRAVEERLKKLRMQTKNNRKGVAKELLALGKECASLPILDDRTPDEILYDKHGLPKA